MFARCITKRVSTQFCRSRLVCTFSNSAGNVKEAPVYRKYRTAPAWIADIRKHAQKDLFLKRSKMNHLLQDVVNKEELRESLDIMKIYEEKRIDLMTNAAAEFIKKAIQLDECDLVIKAMEEKYRFMLFLEPKMLAKLNIKLINDDRIQDVYKVHQIAKEHYEVKENRRLNATLILAAVKEGDYDKALSFAKEAAENNKLSRVSCNLLLARLQESQSSEQFSQALELMKEAGISFNETTNKIIARL
ncbi:unnamed protein product [Albugo candida]|uniref:Pentacotripeptide-repeat region of PRORP domain-containing protein n=2 Tax=Albugo candida TaxID=65357 RepID=A0A024G1Y0_9STRA|nr:unnamed protein product [Albugo candida]|eukprot:CCI40843.1 unnamed protein product [Albugo candida]